MLNRRRRNLGAVAVPSVTLGDFEQTSFANSHVEPAVRAAKCLTRPDKPLEGKGSRQRRSEPCVIVVMIIEPRDSLAVSSNDGEDSSAFRALRQHIAPFEPKLARLAGATGRTTVLDVGSAVRGRVQLLIVKQHW